MPAIRPKTQAGDPLSAACRPQHPLSSAGAIHRRTPRLQAEYAAWWEVLPDSLRDTATAAALQAIVDLDLDELAAIVPPRGYGRD